MKQFAKRKVFTKRFENSVNYFQFQQHVTVVDTFFSLNDRVYRWNTWNFYLIYLVLQAGFNAKNLYEAMYLYGLWINHTLTHSLNRKDGRAWLQFSKNVSFESTCPCYVFWSKN